MQEIMVGSLIAPTDSWYNQTGIFMVPAAACQLHLSCRFFYFWQPFLLATFTLELSAAANPTYMRNFPHM